MSKQFLSVENPKWHRAQMGAWRCETDYAPPFDYYYEDDGGYTPGMTEWEAAMAALLAEGEPLRFHRVYDGQFIAADGKETPDHITHALALRDFVPGDFTETYFGNKPEGAEDLSRDILTLWLPDLRMWLYFYNDSPWVQIHHAGEDYWAQVHHVDAPGEEIFDAALAWLDAARA